MAAILRPYGVAANVPVPVSEDGGTDLTSPTFASGDVKISKDEGAFANTTNLPTAITSGSSHYLALTATEMQAARIQILVVDATPTKTWADQVIYIETYGNASAMHAFDLDVATQDVNVASIDAGAITASAIAADAIGASELAADAAAEIADAVWDEAKAGHVSAGSFGEEVQAHALSSEITALNDPTAAAIADAVWDEAVAGHVAGGSFGEEVQLHALSSEIAALNDPTAAAIADAVWDEVASGHTTTGTFGALVNDLSLVSIADGIWDEVMESGAPANAQTAREGWRILMAFVAGIDAGTGSWSAKSLDGSKTRISATLDSEGKRTAVGTLDGS